MTKRKWHQRPTSNAYIVDDEDGYLVAECRSAEIAATVVADHNARLGQGGGQEPQPVAYAVRHGGDWSITGDKGTAEGFAELYRGTVLPVFDPVPVAARPDQPAVEWRKVVMAALRARCWHRHRAEGPDGGCACKGKCEEAWEDYPDDIASMEAALDAARAALSRAPAGPQWPDDEVRRVRQLARYICRWPTHNFPEDLRGHVDQLRELVALAWPAPPRDETEGDRE